MSLRRRLVGSGFAVLVTAVGVMGSAAPAMADPPTPAGCVFNQSTGTTTCVTTTTSTTAPFTGSGDSADGSPGAVACLVENPYSTNLHYYDVRNVVLGTTTTTTTTYQGASPGNGQKTTTTTQRHTSVVSFDLLTCSLS